MMEFLESLDWSPLIISLKTGVVATIVCFFLGLFAARKVIKLSYKAKAIVDGILTLPMVFPPTVAGFILLLVFSRRRPFGIFLDQQLEFTGNHLESRDHKNPDDQGEGEQHRCHDHPGDEGRIDGYRRYGFYGMPFADGG